MLQQMIDRVVTEFHPQRVVLFGSQATGEADAQSDVDLLVVSDLPGTNRDQAMAIRRSLGLFPVPCDVFVRTPQEFQRQRGVVNNIVYFADRYGKVVYER